MISIEKWEHWVALTIVSSMWGENGEKGNVSDFFLSHDVVTNGRRFFFYVTITSIFDVRVNQFNNSNRKKDDGALTTNFNRAQ